jgi:hypothetical protein
MARVEKIVSWSTYKHFEAPTLEAAIELARVDKEENWQYSEDDSVDYFFGETNAKLPN